jgi:hypothetical protein
VRIDMSRVASAAIEAALDEEKPRRRRLTGVKAIATGAALAVAAQAAAKRAPVHRLADLASMPERLRERVQERGWLDDDEPDSRNGHYDEPVDEEDEDYEPEDEEDEEDEDEPEDEEDEDFEPEDEDDEPRADARDEEPEAEADEPDEPDEPDRRRERTENGAPAADVPNVLALLSARRPRPRFMSRATARVDPAARPPEPPESDSDDERSETTQEAGS